MIACMYGCAYATCLCVVRRCMLKVLATRCVYSATLCGFLPSEQSQELRAKEITPSTDECLGKVVFPKRLLFFFLFRSSVLPQRYVENGSSQVVGGERAPTEGNFPLVVFCTVCSCINHKLICVWWMLWGAKTRCLLSGDGCAGNCEMLTLLKMALPDVRWRP